MSFDVAVTSRQAPRSSSAKLLVKIGNFRPKFSTYVTTSFVRTGGLGRCWAEGLDPS